MIKKFILGVILSMTAFGLYMRNESINNKIDVYSTYIKKGKTFADCITYLNNNLDKKYELLLTQETITLTQSETIPTNAITIKSVRGGKFTGAYTLTFTGQYIDCSDNQSIMDQTVTATGNVNNIFCLPEWFGAIPDDGIDDANAIINALEVAESGIHFGYGEYHTSKTVTVNRKSVLGTGRYSRVNQTTKTLNVFCVIGFVRIEGLQIYIDGITSSDTISTAGAGIQLGDGGSNLIDRTSTFKNLYIHDVAIGFYADNQNVYSCTFDTIEIGRTSQYCWYLNCPGATGNRWSNIYISNWNDFGAGTKMFVSAAFYLLGSHDDGVVNQFNIEHTYMNHGVILNGVKNFVFNSLHFEDAIPTNNLSSFIYLLNSRVVVNGMTIMDTEFDGTKGANSSIYRIENSSGNEVEVHHNLLRVRNNTKVSSPQLRKFYRTGSLTATPDPKVYYDGFQIESGIFDVANYVPSAEGLPLIRRANGVDIQIGTCLIGTDGAVLSAGGIATWNAEEYDTCEMGTPTAGIVTIPENGVYRIHYKLPQATGAAVGQFATLKINNINDDKTYLNYWPSANYSMIEYDKAHDLDEGDTITIFLDTGNIERVSTYNMKLEVYKIK